MKATSLKTAAVLAGSLGLFAGSAMAQSSTSGVVGYETVDFGAGFSFVGARLHEAPVASGTLETVTTNSATDDQVDLGAIVDAGGSFILEIEDGSGIIQVVTTSSGTGVAANDLSGVANGAAYTLRPSATIATIFGANNEAGLASAATFGASDQVWLPDGSGDFDKYYFAAGAFGAPGEWKTDAGASVDPTLIDIVYTDGIIMNSGAGGSVVITGDLVTSDTLVAVADGFNFLGSVYPVGANIESTFGANNEAGLTSAASFGASDQVWISDGAGDFDKYFFAAGAFGAPGEWKNDAGASITPASIDIPSGYIINNTGGAQNVATTAPSFYAGL